MSLENNSEVPEGKPMGKLLSSSDMEHIAIIARDNAAGYIKNMLRSETNKLKAHHVGN